MSYRPALALDDDRLQLAPGYPQYKGACSVPGFRTRVVQKLPLESCLGPLCVRWRDGRLLRSHNRGRTWDDLTEKLPNDLRRDPIIVTAAAAGREILLGVRRPWRHNDVHESQLEVWRSTDDGVTFAAWTSARPSRHSRPAPTAGTSARRIAGCGACPSDPRGLRDLSPSRLLIREQAALAARYHVPVLVLLAALALEIHAAGACPAAADVERQLAPLLGEGAEAARRDVATIEAGADGAVSLTLADANGQPIGAARPAARALVR